MDNRGSRALRNDFQVHTDQELVSMVEEDKKVRQEAEDSEMAELTTIASLADHPGYKILRERRLKTIADYRSGKVLAPCLLDANISNAKLGELTRTTNLVADELEKELTIVEASVEARREELDGKRPQRGRI